MRHANGLDGISSCHGINEANKAMSNLLVVVAG